MRDLTDYVLIEGEEYYVENHDPHIVDKQKLMDRLEGDLTYIGYWFVKDAKGYVFHCSNPDRSKGYKDYVILKYQYNYIVDDYDFYICGYDQEEMEQLSYQTGLACRKCKTVIWSLYRHDYHGCRCEDKHDGVCVDGGMDYFRCSHGNNSNSLAVRVDHLKKQITRPKRKK